MSPKRLSTVIRRYRNAKGISQRDLAAKVGVKGPYIAQLETGARTNPSLDVLKKIAKVLGLPAKHLVQPESGRKSMDIFDAALSALEPDRRVCVPCWGDAADLTSPTEQRRLRAFAQALVGGEDPIAERGGMCSKCGRHVDGLTVRALPSRTPTRS
jgi:transcriptional regulator with XRE-family HTH domain